MILLENFGGLSTKRLKNFEEKHILRLPVDYRCFLLKNNGGYIENGNFLINDFQGEDRIEVFHGLDLKQRFSNIEYLIETYSDRFNVKVLPIGHDGGGNFICLDVNEGQNYGKVYFYDNEVDNENDDGSLNRDNLYLISNSFTEFLEKLH